MKKYFVFADVHGFYDELEAALEAKGFEEDNPNHIIVSLGDAYDRGPQPAEVIRFLLWMHENGRAILIRGNHEELMEDLLDRRRKFSWIDMSNGTFKTLDIIAAITEEEARNTQVVFPNDEAISLKDFLSINTELIDYHRLLRNCVEIDNHIFVHGWIPSRGGEASLDEDGNYVLSPLSYDPDWRRADREAWQEAMWSNGMEMYERGIVEKGSTIYCGHWHTSWGHERDGNGSEWGSDAVFLPYVKEGIVALDGCTSHSGFVNVVVVEI